MILILYLPKRLILIEKQQLTMKSKDFDDFSFKARSSQPSQTEIPAAQRPHPKVIKPSDIHFRHTSNIQPKNSIFDHQINTKIRNIDQQLEENIKRRVELERKLERIRSVETQRKKRQIFDAYSNQQYQPSDEVAKGFKDMREKADRLEKVIAPTDVLTMNRRKEEAQARNLEQLKEKLLDIEDDIPVTTKQKVLIPIIQTMAAYKPKPIPVYTAPDQIKIQQLLRKVTFPQVPSGNLQTLQKQVQTLFAVHKPHSDIHYLCMLINFHSQKYQKVRKHFEQIVMFKTFNQKAYWVAAQSEFALSNYELCLSQTQQCLSRLQQKLWPRMIYLKARCYDQLANYINSIICYNQLVKLKPKISEYYLQRGILYHRVGYYREAKEDFVMFGLLRPDAEQFIKQKILGEGNQIRRKEYIALLAKMY